MLTIEGTDRFLVISLLSSFLGEVSSLTFPTLGQSFTPKKKEMLFPTLVRVDLGLSLLLEIPIDQST